jgi:hypothetical protein
MTRMNWKAANDRRRVREHGAETVGGQMHGTAPASIATKTEKPKPEITALAEPVEFRFWKNRGGEAVVVSLRSYQGRALIDVRQSFTNKEGKLQPTSKGVAMAVLRLPELAAAINGALNKARELGLLKGEGTA